METCLGAHVSVQNRSAEPDLRVDGLRKRFGSLTAVDGLDFAVQRGEIFGLLGPNGAGKSTTIKMLCGLLPVDSGSVRLRSGDTWIDLTRRAAGQRERIGLCPQEIVVWSNLSCRENLCFMASMYNVPPVQARKRADALLSSLALADKARAPARTLSGGMQRRLNLAMALVNDPDLVILDEPEAGLDPQSRVLVRDYIRSLARRETVILTTHDIGEAQRACDRVAIVDQGRLLACGTPDELVASYAAGAFRIDAVIPGGAVAIDDACSRLRAAGYDCSSQAVAESVSIAVTRESELSAVVALLGKHNPPEDIRLRRATLEDVFIKLTGRSIRS